MLPKGSSVSGRVIASNASTSSDGSYVVHGIPSGRIQVTAQTYGERSLTKVIQVDEGTQELTLNIQFPTEARLSGRITRGGQAVTHAAVQVWTREPGVISASAKTDANGRYVIEGLSNGDYLIKVQGARGSKSQRISGPTLLDIELEP